MNPIALHIQNNPKAVPRRRVFCLIVVYSSWQFCSHTTFSCSKLVYFPSSISTKEMYSNFSWIVNITRRHPFCLVFQHWLSFMKKKTVPPTYSIQYIILQYKISTRKRHVEMLKRLRNMTKWTWIQRPHKASASFTYMLQDGFESFPPVSGNKKAVSTL